MVGAYRVVEQLGEGGMATVYKAFQPALERMVALKVLPDFFAGKPDFRDRFRREAKAVAQLRHSNIPVVFDYGQEGSVAYIASELVEGGTLAQRLRGAPLSLGEAVRWLAPIAAALDYAHSRGVLHRDIKPSNILVGLDGTPYLSDFGLARMVGGETERLTATGMVLGTPEYMSPEQCVGAELSNAADIYSLSVIAYEMLTGRVPFRAATPVAVIMAQVHDPLPLPRTINPALPPAAEAALLRGLAKIAGDRFGTAAELVAGLSAAALGGAPKPPPVAVPLRVTRPPRAPLRSRPRLLAGAAAVTVLLVAAAGVGFWRAHSGGSGTATAGGPAHGTTIFAAALDGSGNDLQEVQAGGGAVEHPAGAIVLKVLKAGDVPSANLKMNPVTDYVGELTLTVQPGSSLEFVWGLRNAGDGQQASVILDLKAPDGTLVLLSVPYQGDPRALTPDVQVPALQSGRALTLAAVVSGTHYTIYLDGRQVASANDGSATGPTDPQLSADGSHGTVSITSAHVYRPA
jgi:Protein kinase domain